MLRLICHSHVPCHGPGSRSLEMPQDQSVGTKRVQAPAYCTQSSGQAHSVHWYVGTVTIHFSFSIPTLVTGHRNYYNISLCTLGRTEQVEHCNCRPLP